MLAALSKSMLFHDEFEALNKDFAHTCSATIAHYPQLRALQNPGNMVL
jgi:hypothetical protein